MKTIRLLLCILVAVTATCLPSGLSRAGTVNPAEIESLLGKYKLGGSVADEIVRAWRGAVNVGINGKRLEGLIGQALSSGMDAKHVIRAVTLLSNTALNGLPVNPVLNKLSEGLAKRVDQDDLIDAIEKRALSLKQARQLLSVLIYEDKPLGDMEFVIVAVGSALERGVDERKIEEIFRKEGPDLRKMVIEVESLR
jgi:hypothetical protein